MNEFKGVLKYKDDIIKEIQNLIKIPSVLGKQEENAPFGKKPKEALEYILNLGHRLGFETRNFDNFIGDISFNPSTKESETLGILGHVDVVEAGNDWDYPPFSGIIADNYLYGRGVLDDKGPIVICLYALKYLSEIEKKFSRNVKLIIGANEETGCKCIEHYFKTLKLPQPEIAFSPDGEFPVINIEKGMLKGFFKIPLPENYLEIKGSAKGNLVPDYIECTINEDEPITYISKGKSAHAAHADKGINAFLSLMILLKDKKFKNSNFNKLISFFNKYIKMEYDGKSLGINYKDIESGELTLNYSNIFVENSTLVISIDCRFPISTDIEKVQEILKERALEYDIIYSTRKITKPHYIPETEFLVQELLKAYNSELRLKNSFAKYTGGSTYSRSIKKCVAFGPIMPEMENTIHKKNERISINDLEKLILIYTRAIYNLIKGE